MSHHSWFERKIEGIVRKVERGTDAGFDRVVDEIDKLAKLYDRFFGWLPDVDESPMAVALGGSADALGQNTRAEAHLQAELTDHGAVSVSVGRARFEAAAEAGPVNPDAFAFAEASAAIDGADFVIMLDRTVTGPNWAKASHAHIAIDLAALDLAEPIEFTFEVEREARRARDVAEGNVASTDVDAQAGSEDTFVDVEVDLLAVEDALSGSSVEAVLGIG
jgi:hypothetical protein